MPSALNESICRALHDAILLDVQIAWEAGTVAVGLRLGVPPGKVTITGIDVVMVQCPRQQPWGASRSVNAVSLLSPQEGGQRLEIEMQSGDVVLIDALEFRIDERPKPG